MGLSDSSPSGPPLLAGEAPAEQLFDYIADFRGEPEPRLSGGSRSHPARWSRNSLPLVGQHLRRSMLAYSG
jgi:hypothetical protein